MQNFNIKISIILPIYNVEKYINRCLESIFCQDVPICEFEVIAVNDCSTDNSRNLLLQWQKRYNNLYIIDHAGNYLPGTARNTGLKVAKGKYVWFIDADDFILCNCFVNVLSFIESNNLDILSFNYFKQDMDYRYNPDTLNSVVESEVIDGSLFLEKYYQPLFFSPCSKIFRKKFILKNHFYFSEGVFWEDADIVVKMIYYSKRIKYIPDHLYYYCFNGLSISRKNNWKKTADMIKMGYRKVIFAESISLESPTLSIKIIQDGAWNAGVIKKIIFYTYSERRLFYKEIGTDVRFKMGHLVENKMLKIFYYQRCFTQLILFFLSPLFRIIKKSVNNNI